jgi:hypothetical protein
LQQFKAQQFCPTLEHRNLSRLIVVQSIRSRTIGSKSDAQKTARALAKTLGVTRRKSQVNKQYILYNLRDALEELRSTISEIERTPDYGYGEYVVAMSHLYHHVNTAWNARDASESEANECSEQNFLKWRMFPDYSELHIEDET